MGRQVVIFCASSQDIDPKYNEAARTLVRELHARGYDVVSGGGARGTMGAITSESVRVGGRHKAVLPRFMQGLENPDVNEHVWTDTMARRKEEMRKDTVAAIALPGGIGTLEELVETHTLRKLHRYQGAIYALNLDGFYNPLKALYAHYAATGMTAPSDLSLVEFPDTLEELLAHFA